MKGIYKHYKGPLYEVVGAVVHSETLEELVLYRSLKGSPEYPSETLWVRPKEMFLGTVEIDGKRVSRFEKQPSTEASTPHEAPEAQKESYKR